MHSHKRYGILADRLGNGLQNRVEQFDSARCLSFKRVISNIEVTLFLLYMGHKKGENRRLSLLYYDNVAKVSLNQLNFIDILFYVTIVTSQYLLVFACSVEDCRHRFIVGDALWIVTSNYST